MIYYRQRRWMKSMVMIGSALDGRVLNARSIHVSAEARWRLCQYKCSDSLWYAGARGDKISDTTHSMCGIRTDNDFNKMCRPSA
jgi:hypothetical protein